MSVENPKGQLAVNKAQTEQQMTALDIQTEKLSIEAIIQQALQVEKDGSRKTGLENLLKRIRKSNDRTEYKRLFDEALEKNQSLKTCLDRHNSSADALQLIGLGISQSGAQIVTEINANNRKWQALSNRVDENEQQNEQDKKRLRDNLRQQTELWDDDKAALQKTLRLLKEENKELEEKLDMRDKEIKGLKKKLKQLEEEKSELETELKKVKSDLNSVHGEMDRLETDVTSLKQENRNLCSNLDKTQQEFNDFKESTNQQMFTLHDELEKARATNAEDISESDNYVIALSEVYTKLQTSLYKKVHPALLLGKQTQRTVKELKKHLTSKYRNDADEKVRAEKRWDELQAQLDWDDDYMDAIKDIKRMRNTAAHPSFDEDMIPGYVGYVTKLKREGSISDDLAQQAEALVNMFCKLKDLGC